MAKSTGIVAIGALVVGFLASWFIFDLRDDRIARLLDQQQQLAGANDSLRQQLADAQTKQRSETAQQAQEQLDLRLGDLEDSLRRGLERQESNMRAMGQELAQRIAQAAFVDEARYLQLLEAGLRQQAAGDHEAAIGQFSKAILTRPDAYAAYVNRGFSYQLLGQWQPALDDFSRARQLSPEQYSPWNNIAWIRATCPDAKLRDGDEAVRHAERACELTHWLDPAVISTLAAAHAESGDFETATLWQSEAIQEAPPGLIDELRKTLQLYEKHEPCRSSPTAPSTDATNGKPNMTQVEYPAAGVHCHLPRWRFALSVTYSKCRKSGPALASIPRSLSDLPSSTS